MIAKFQIILEGVTPLKIQCLKTFSDEKLKQKGNTILLKVIQNILKIYLKAKIKKS